MIIGSALIYIQSSSACGFRLPLRRESTEMQIALQKISAEHVSVACSYIACSYKLNALGNKPNSTHWLIFHAESLPKCTSSLITLCATNLSQLLQELEHQLRAVSYYIIFIYKTIESSRRREKIASTCMRCALLRRTQSKWVHIVPVVNWSQ